MAHRVGESRFLPPENLRGQVASIFKGVAQQVLALAVAVHLQIRVQRHDVGDKVQIPKGHPGLQGVDGDAPVRPEHVVHVQLPQALLGFLLESQGAGGEVRVLVAEQLVGNLPGQQHPDVRLLVDGLAHQVHSQAGPDGGDVIGAQQLDDLLQRCEDVFRRHVHLGVVAADVVRHLPGVLQVDGVLAHADGKGADGLPAFPGGNGAHQRGVQAPGKEEAHLGVGHQALLHAGYQLLPDEAAGVLQAVVGNHIHLGDVPVAVERPALVVVPRREGAYLPHQAHQVLGLAGEDDYTLGVVAVVQRPDADGVPGGQELPPLPVVEDAGEFRVQHLEHPRAVLLIKGQEDFAVAAAAEGVALFLQLGPHGLKAVQLAVAHREAAPQLEGLHAGGIQPHNGQAVKAQQALAHIHHAGVVGAAGEGPVKPPLKRPKIGAAAAVTHNRTHKQSLQSSCSAIL